MITRTTLAAYLAATFVLCAPFCAAQSVSQGNTPPDTMQANPSSAVMEAGFHDLYVLNFKDAREQFLVYQKMEPSDPLGKAAEAASYLYEQFYDKGVFSSSFFLNDQKFLGGVDGTPAQNRNDAFLNANKAARDMAALRLKSDLRDRQGLLVITLTDGMESDYDALIIKKQMAGLGMMRQAEGEAAKLLAADPSEQDAYLALGASNYVIGCLPGYKRAFVWFGGVHGDRARGLEELQLAADRGNYLRPFAKIFLALAFEREHQMDHARVLLTELTAEFPGNPLFAHELSLVDHPATVSP